MASIRRAANGRIAGRRKATRAARGEPPFGCARFAPRRMPRGFRRRPRLDPRFGSVVSGIVSAPREGQPSAREASLRAEAGQRARRDRCCPEDAAFTACALRVLAEPQFKGGARDQAFGQSRIPVEGPAARRGRQAREGGGLRRGGVPHALRRAGRGDAGGARRDRRCPSPASTRATATSRRARSGWRRSPDARRRRAPRSTRRSPMRKTIGARYIQVTGGKVDGRAAHGGAEDLHARARTRVARRRAARHHHRDRAAQSLRRAGRVPEPHAIRRPRSSRSSGGRT